MEIDKIEQLLRPELTGLDEEMARIIGSDHPFLQSLADRIMSAPGKRLRPKLLVLCAKMLGYEGEHALTYATVFELIHTATLIHDDIIDDARTRRGLPTMNAEIGNVLTVLYGDLLYTKSHTRAIEAGRLDVMHTIDQVSERMIEGELLQNKYSFDATISEDTYFDILMRKTAYLFGGTTKTAALICDRPEDEVAALYEYGFQLGISFQLMDDYLDYTGDAAQMGKPVLSDLVEGKVTLPLILLREQQGDDRVRHLVEQCWEAQDGQVPAELMALLEESNVLQETLRRAEQAANKALAQISAFPDNVYGQVLRALPMYLLNRRK